MATPRPTSWTRADTGRLNGLDGDDSLYAGWGSATLAGGAGNDYYTLDGGYGSIVELAGEGTDSVYAYLEGGDSFTLADNVESLAIDYGSYATINGNASANTISGSDYRNTINGLNGADSLYGLGGNDTLDGGGGTDYFDGGAGSDTVLYTGNATSVRIDLVNQYASFPGQSWPSEYFTGIENAFTGSGADSLFGNSAANELRGGGGADRLNGFEAADRLIGGGGNDTFVFAANGSAPGARDLIAAGDGAIAFEKAGAQLGDRIDLAAIDANTTAGGNQTFVFGGTGKGHLWAANSGNQTVIRGNVDNDAAAEFELAIDDGSVGAAAYKAVDFIL
jgi:Ca2+-binding RTX toxin-like protein